MSIRSRSERAHSRLPGMNEPGAALDLGPENEEQLARLRRALSLEAGFQLVLLEVAQPGLAKEILRRLHRWSGRDGIPALAVVRTRPGRDPVAPLRCIAGGAVLVGIDQPFDLDGIELVTVDDSGPDARSDAPARDPVEYTMTTLNWYRDELPSLVAGPLVLVLSPDGLRQLFVHAPDLLAWCLARRLGVIALAKAATPGKRAKVSGNRVGIASRSSSASCAKTARIGFDRQSLP